MASHGGGGATQRHSLSTSHPNGAPVAKKEDTAAVAELLFVRLISKDLKVVVCLLVGEEEKQTQELAMDASRGRHACQQESHLPIALMWGHDRCGSCQQRRSRGFDLGCPGCGADPECNNWHRLGVMNHMHVTHACRRRILQHVLIRKPGLHDALGDQTLCR